MADQLRVGRLFMLLLGIITLGRWIQSIQHVPYDKAHHVFSIVTLTFFSSVLFAAFCRKWRGYTLAQALILGVLFGFMAQVVIFSSTVISYLAGMETFFNNPRALNVEAPISLSEALPRRLGGLFFGSFFSGIAAGLGWLMGALLPDKR